MYKKSNKHKVGLKPFEENIESLLLICGSKL